MTNPSGLQCLRLLCRVDRARGAGTGRRQTPAARARPRTAANDGPHGPPHQGWTALVAHNGFRDFELSCQSTLHPSFTLLVRYRLCDSIHPGQGYTCRFELQCQEALLRVRTRGEAPDPTVSRCVRGCHPVSLSRSRQTSSMAVQTRHAHAFPPLHPATQTNHKPCGTRHLRAGSSLRSCHFTRRYLDNHRCLLFHASFKLELGLTDFESEVSLFSP